ncbi:FadR/GntR family transcriptional regulator [Paenibacillus pasadenensis]|uniref:Transcriptional regulator, GntR family n=1 Tax=Paenibacillus pasadenensis TaxID=217090 RepID=A0A2N5N2T6_9BACL|nr:FadR/GntR family transcriptional regulator [Paenibacillus pasadenensis]PLT44642.1 Transcriptional regulator, GntR family [Paenibacillus pasadenensis]
MEVKPLNKQNHYEAIAGQLRRLIDDGSVKPGDKLPSARELSERFGVGRSTMREALSALKAMGYIDIRQGGGSVVRPPEERAGGLPPLLAAAGATREELLELLEARRSLELANVALAARKRSADDVARLRELAEGMSGTLGDDLEGERYDMEFHLALAHATGNRMMARLYESLMAPIERAIRAVRRTELYASREVAGRLADAHERILLAVEAGDEALAAAEMQAHLEHVERIVMKHL